MHSTSPETEQSRISQADSENPESGGLRPIAILALSAWCGLCAGLGEVGIILLRKRYFDSNQFYGLSRHFTWLLPIVELLVFITFGLMLVLTGYLSRRARPLVPRALATFSLIAILWSAFPRLFGPASLLLALGVAINFVPILERRQSAFRKFARTSFAGAFCLLVLLASLSWAASRREARRESVRPLPPNSPPNVLLIVLDTVAAGHLGTFGYDRPTSPTLDELAARGICFKQARATASWTLPSHASMFTGKWPHELSAGWFTPLDREAPTLAEYLGAHGYATAGFAANVAYCAADSGLSRGYTTYHDFIFPKLTAFYLSTIVRRIVDGIQGIESVTTFVIGQPVIRSPADLIWRLFGKGRKEARVVSREFLDWLAARPQPDRPFFAFLNYYDAHYPYELPSNGIHRFGAVPKKEWETAVLRDWNDIQKQGPTKRQIAFARDAYDDCVADLDEQLGELLDELERRSILEHTWVIITADHGESFGEHRAVFVHGTSLYKTETHVPLLFIPPGGAKPSTVIDTPVSLREVAATVAEIVGINSGSPFGGESLARFWNETGAAPASDRPASSPVVLELAPEVPLYAAPSASDPRVHPVAALVDGDWSYTRREVDSLELLFNLRDDAGENQNLARDPGMRPRMQRMRDALRELTKGPLTPDRFNP